MPPIEDQRRASVTYARTSAFSELDHQLSGQCLQPHQRRHRPRRLPLHTSNAASSAARRSASRSRLLDQSRVGVTTRFTGDSRTLGCDYVQQHIELQSLIRSELLYSLDPVVGGLCMHIFGLSLE